MVIGRLMLVLSRRIRVCKNLILLAMTICGVVFHVCVCDRKYTSCSECNTLALGIIILVWAWYVVAVGNVTVAMNPLQNSFTESQG